MKFRSAILASLLLFSVQGMAADAPSRSLVDTDNDGLPDTWEHLYTQTTTDMHPDSDYDHDGLSNLMEYEMFSNHADAAVRWDGRDEAKSRISPLLTDLNVTSITDPAEDVKKNGWIAGHEYTISWTLTGYDEHRYATGLAMFDCRGLADGECGNTYGASDRFTMVPGKAPAVQESRWSYWPSDETQDKVFATDQKYTTTFTMPLNGANNVPFTENTELVFRWYQRASDLNIPNGSGAPDYYFLSLQVSTEAVHIYDKYGRRISTTVSPPSN